MASQLDSNSLRKYENFTSPNIHFKGWRYPQKKWKQWVDRLALKNTPTWEKAGIYNAVMASTCEIRRDKALVIGLVEFWCPFTNTFLFPFGEATVTIEDILVLGGYSVLGEPVSSPVAGKLLEIKEEISQKHKWFSTTAEKKASCSAWMNHFMESEENNDLQHVAFLVLWLSRYVFPANPQCTVGKHVFTIAIHLAQGTRISLAQAVLASLYRDLRVLNEHVMASNAFQLSVWSPFQILQLWAWERFVGLRPVGENGTRRGYPRAVRWHKLNSNMKLPFVRKVLRSGESFQWRCYGHNVENENWVSGFSTDELVGLGCREQYFPHRVAKQFGIDEKLIKNLKCRGSVATEFLPPKNKKRNLKDSTDDDTVENLTFSERLKLMNHRRRSVSNDSIDDEHLPLSKRMKPLVLETQKTCYSSVQQESPSSSIQSQTSAALSVLMNESQTMSKFSIEHYSGVDDCEGLENRVLKLEEEIAGIKARLKAKVAIVGKVEI